MNAMEKLVELIFDSLCRHIDKSCKLADCQNHRKENDNGWVY